MNRLCTDNIQKLLLSLFTSLHWTFGPCQFLGMPAYSIAIFHQHTVFFLLFFCALLTCLVFGTIHIFNNKSLSLSLLVDSLAFDLMQLNYPSGWANIWAVWKKKTSLSMRLESKHRNCKEIKNCMGIEGL